MRVSRGKTSDRRMRVFLYKVVKVIEWIFYRGKRSPYKLLITDIMSRCQEKALGQKDQYQARGKPRILWPTKKWKEIWGARW